MNEEQQRIHDLVVERTAQHGKQIGLDGHTFDVHQWLLGLRESTKEPVQLPMIV